MKPEEWNDGCAQSRRDVSLHPGLQPGHDARQRIVNVTSVVGEIGNAGQANYAAAKAGIIGFTRSVARELAGRGVTVNAVAPGYIETAMTSGLPEAAKAALLASIPVLYAGVRLWISMRPPAELNRGGAPGS
jgi:NAD(P)-dependent dehydrogenase (short-subunit alcohol dehydrogenase family)